MVKAFRCSHSGLYFPADYIKEWGRKYGIGLGSQPISEVLDSNYLQPVAVCDVDHSKSMHPMGVTRCQVDMVEVSEEEYEANKAIIASDDPLYLKRAKIVQDKQKVKSGKLRSILGE